MAEAVLSCGCGLCGQLENLERCTECEVMQYCGPDHKAAHYPKHKAACNGIKRKKATMGKQEKKLLDYPERGMRSPNNYFEQFTGIFWGVHETRPYLRTRFGLVEMRRIKSVESVELQLEHLMEMLRLSRHDNIGARYFVPGALLRLNRDQDCYDFVKSWTMLRDGRTIKLYEESKNSDVFEPVESVLGRFHSIHIAVPLLLLKVKILLDLERLEQVQLYLPRRVRAVRGVVDQIQRLVPLSPIVAKDPSLMRREGRRIAIEKLKSQIDTLFWTVERKDRLFWPFLMNPRRYLREGPVLFGADDQMRFSLKNQHAMRKDPLGANFDAWNETPCALDVLEAKIKQAGRAISHVMPLEYPGMATAMSELERKHPLPPGPLHPDRRKVPRLS